MYITLHSLISHGNHFACSTPNYKLRQLYLVTTSVLPLESSSNQEIVLCVSFHVFLQYVNIQVEVPVKPQGDQTVSLHKNKPLTINKPTENPFPMWVKLQVILSNKYLIIMNYELLDRNQQHVQPIILWSIFNLDFSSDFKKTLSCRFLGNVLLPPNASALPLQITFALGFSRLIFTRFSQPTLTRIHNNDSSFSLWSVQNGQCWPGYTRRWAKKSITITAYSPPWCKLSLMLGGSKRHHLREWT